MADEYEILLCDDSARARLADDLDDGSFTMEEEDASGLEEGKDGKTTNKTCFLKIKKILRTIYKAVSSVVGLLILLAVYSVIGAAIFRAIEGPHEKAHRDNITSNREETVRVLQELSSNLSQGLVNETQWNLVARGLLLRYEETVVIAQKNGVVNSTKTPTWTFWQSMFFCGTIYTTIGYGHIAPSTDLGRMMTMVYAAIGIPLALVCLADLGKHFTLGLKLMWAFSRRYCNCRKKMRNARRGKYTPDDVEDGNSSTKAAIKPGDRVYYGYKIDDEFNIPISFAIGILVLYIFLGAIMYALWEKWSFLESFYFVFISISTIGFGDVLPAHPKFFLLSSVYVFIGLSLVSMCVNVAIEFFSKTIDKAKVNIDRAKTKAKEKAKEAKEKMHEVSKTIDRAKDRAKERVTEARDRVTDFAHVKRRSTRGSPSSNRASPSSDDVKSETATPKSSPISETPEETPTNT
ncbi:TWiK family of potassium channels protein 18-like isoform X3 [Haliotis rufescens]|uniref:TWiK family of potassium channels protein 18-like isoform X3 n=1 Tax=Haliotis rufescens TaxID=6454 RepID=UPI001EB04DE9|nr:TWiK family of potassium channels protein 18-like isoform X3 [Haliotis rufescens]